MVCTLLKTGACTNLKCTLGGFFEGCPIMPSSGAVAAAKNKPDGKEMSIQCPACGHKIVIDEGGDDGDYDD